MKSYQEELEEFKKEAASEYFKMQMREEKKRMRLYTIAVLLMVFLPILIVGFRTYKNFKNYEKNQQRLQTDAQEIENFAESLLKDEKFLKSLSFQNGVAKVWMEAFYEKDATHVLEKRYFDEEYTHQCLGYFLITQEETYQVYTADYCKM